MTQPVVVKLGGDALASAHRIVAQAHRLAAWSQARPIVAVASARRGVTDHLLGLVREIRTGARGTLDPGSHPEADRAIAAGEVVSASLLALALGELGVRAVSLDAREAGLHGSGDFGHGRIRRVNTSRIERELSRGVLPVITGFQGWRGGRVVTLGRGGTDSSAVSLTAALGGTRCVLVKDSPGLRTADPRIVPASRIIAEAPHNFLTALAEAGAKVVQAEAAREAEHQGVVLEFVTLTDDRPQSVVTGDAPDAGLRAIAALAGDGGLVTISAIGPVGSSDAGQLAQLRAALIQGGIAIVSIERTSRGVCATVPAADATSAARIAHAAFIESIDTPLRSIQRAS
ncbi:MAG: hypothetical protein ABI765_10080 [Gemmatimonadota bacterium]